MAQPPFFFGEIATNVRSLNGEDREEKQVSEAGNNRSI